MPELIHIDGKPFILVPMHEYRKLVHGDSRGNSGGNSAPATSLPDTVLDQIVAKSDHPVRILRKFRGMTQMELAMAAGLSRPYLTEIETGRKDGSIAAIKALAAALGVEVGLLL